MTDYTCFFGLIKVFHWFFQIS